MTVRVLRGSVALLILWVMAASFPSEAKAQVTPDSIVMRDTLLPSFYQIEHRPLRAGFAPIYGWSQYSTGEIPLPMALPGCDRYSAGSGHDLGLTLLAEIPFWGDYSPWSVGPFLFFQSHSALFSWTQQFLGREAGHEEIVNLSLRHDLDASYITAGLGAEAHYEILPHFGANGALSIGYQTRSQYTASQHTDLSATFSSGSRDSTVGEGTLEGFRRIAPSISLGLDYELILSRSLRARPTLAATYLPFGVTSYWKPLSLTASIAFLFDLTPRFESVPTYVKRQVPVKIERPTTPVIDTPKLTASIEAVAVDNDGNESPVVRMMIEEVKTRNAYPILNYIFFDEGSSQLPIRFVQYQTPEEAERKFQGSTERHAIKLLDLYHETLNILGDRLRKFPASRVTLKGTTSNTGIEANNLQLARKRSESVREYLVKVWKIPSSRIRVEAAVLPDRASPSTTVQGQEENRRVEFTIDEQRAFAPIVVTNIEHLATPDQIRLQPFTSDSNITRWYASISANGTELLSFAGDAESATTRKIWGPTEEVLRNLHDSLSIDYEVTNAAGFTAHAHNTIPLSVTRVATERDERVERFSLILFGFDESKVEARNEQEIENVSSLLLKRPVNRLLIQGYTDESGDPRHNDMLSESRAQEVRKRLQAAVERQHRVMPGKVAIEGRGSRDQLYDNRLPEGRFFSRTVNVTIERTAEK